MVSLDRGFRVTPEQTRWSIPGSRQATWRCYCQSRARWPVGVIVRVPPGGPSLDGQQYGQGPVFPGVSGLRLKEPGSPRQGLARWSVAVGVRVLPGGPLLGKRGQWLSMGIFRGNLAKNRVEWRPFLVRGSGFRPNKPGGLCQGVTRWPIAWEIEPGAQFLHILEKFGTSGVELRSFLPRG